MFNVLIFISYLSWSQESSKIITIIQSGSLEKNEITYPDANILLKKNNIRVHLFHEGADIKSDKSIFYSKKIMILDFPMETQNENQEHCQIFIIFAFEINGTHIFNNF